MARREVVEITCDRCKKTENQEPKEVSKAGKPEFEARFLDASIMFQDLCRSCRSTVENYFKKTSLEYKPKEDNHEEMKPSPSGSGAHKPKTN